MKVLDSTGRSARVRSGNTAADYHSPTTQSKNRSLTNDLNNMNMNISQGSQGNQRSGGSNNPKGSSASNLPQGSQHGRDSMGSNKQNPGNVQARSSFSGRLDPKVPPFQSNSQNQGQGQYTPYLSQHDPISQVQRQSTMMAQQLEIINEASTRYQAKISDLIKKIDRSDGINTEMQATLVRDVRDLGLEYGQQQVQLQAHFNKVVFERDMNLNQLNIMSANLTRAYADRDQFGEEREKMRRSSEQSSLEYQKSIDRLNELVNHWANKNAAALKKIQQQDEQLEGKRALWLLVNPGASPERDAIASALENTVTSPVVAQRSFHGHQLRRASGTIKATDKLTPPSTTPKITGLMGDGFGSAELPSMSYRLPESSASIGQTYRTDGLIAPRRRLTAMPSGPAPKDRCLFLPGPSLTSKRITTHTGADSITWSRSMATPAPASPTAPSAEPSTCPVQNLSSSLVLHVNPKDPSTFYQEQFSELYAMVENWVGSHCHSPNLENDQEIARSNQVLWAFMMNCTYPGQRQDAHTHTMTLLNDTASRPWFVMRMAVSYIVEEILSLAPYKLFSQDVDTALEKVKTRIAERGLAIEARQSLVDQRAAIIQRVVKGPTWDLFRKSQLATHSKALREILGPMLDNNSLRSVAGGDLGAIIIKAWEISVSINSSKLTFQVYFPETAQKFSAATMISKDKHYVDPMTLQIKQVRLKLVITPVVTMRDDRGTTIRAKNLHRANVLTMA
ncbi:hypothetical protein MBM_01761 [Drepanopeziza brunnea f. sp. 'multigermtubi' MB_m1]|uniref:Uncharacterized protein n=1 Tax=Marssonina brunnea f. sp. multigermtubi (strain MB_m1) TaxID=1072389 RepID=K1Y3P5_MARBU|nr:uncharacterized protein MBM_01761 [Drepanopeziza brunnea f. sp. 'multigermtubi' MB_m1]EKD19809.1 hypothetical protein MBM_01761 [Drepanopeziza brunnea f. sp. 'multigermtubi' MB_m1]